MWIAAEDYGLDTGPSEEDLRLTAKRIRAVLVPLAEKATGA